MLKKKINQPSLEQQEKSMSDITSVGSIFALTDGYRDNPYQSLEKIFQEVAQSSHGCIEAVFQINSEIPSHLQKGIFSSLGKKYETLLRFSKNIGDENKQILVKICDVGGAVIEEDNGNCNQDFLMTNANLDDSPNYGFFSHSLFRFDTGHVANFLIKPINRNDLFELTTTTNEEVKNIFYQNELVEFDFMVQLKIAGQPASTESFIKIAKITFSAAQAAIGLISDQACEAVVYNPLHSLVEHQPFEE